MSAVRDAVLAANTRYADSFGSKGKLAMPPARKFAILTCMDARLDPAKYAGLAEDYFLMDVASILRSFSLLAAS